MSFLMDNLGTIIVSAGLIAAVALAAAKLIRDRKRGKSACGCGCSGCAMAGVCGRRGDSRAEGVAQGKN